MQRDIFDRAGMSRSSFTIPPGSESVGYPFPSDTRPSWVYAAGGITSTAADMNRFNQALLSNRFGFGAVESFDRSAAGVTSCGMGVGRRREGFVQHGPLTDPRLTTTFNRLGLEAR